LKLTSDNVHAVLKDCLFEDSELPEQEQIKFVKDNGVLAEGITRIFGFNSLRLESNREIIKSWIEQLSSKFDEGYSFLEMCYTNKGEQWTDLHCSMEELACLGEAIGALSCNAPKWMWSTLLGGVPYYKKS
jgi:hypothetical protein